MRNVANIGLFIIRLYGSLMTRKGEFVVALLSDFLSPFSILTKVVIIKAV